MTFPHLFYTNVLVDAYNKHVFDNSLEEHINLLQEMFLLKHIRLPTNFLIKKILRVACLPKYYSKRDMLMELCA
jgi:hypothetical protein